MTQQIIAASGKVLAVLVFAWVLAFWSYVRRMPTQPKRYRELPASIDLEATKIARVK